MKYKGYVEYFSFKKEGVPHGIYNFVSDDFEDGEMKCLGTVVGIEVGDNLEIEGEQVIHPIYGPQIKVTSFRFLPKDDIISIERYLASGAIKGVGAALASRIVKKFGPDAFRIMEEEPERLAEVKGISERMALEIGVQVLEKRDLREAVMFLSEYGISDSMAIKIYNRYKGDIYRIFRENPYKLAEEIRGIGFLTADEIAAKTGVPQNSPDRIDSGILFCLSRHAGDGNTFMPKEKLLQAAEQLLKQPVESIEERFVPLSIEKKIVIKEEKKVFLHSLYQAEYFCANRLRELGEAFYGHAISLEEKRRVIAEIEEIKEKEEISLDEIQTDAVISAISNGLFILTGGPGTGKTTTIRTIIRYFDGLGQTVLLCAPTGRAAKRMEEATGYEAKTIHRLLEVTGSPEDEDTAVFGRNEWNPLEADVIIVDEMSMVDTLLFKSLLAAVPAGCRLVFSGDSNQLPSVGPGNILKDLMEFKQIPFMTLEKIYRQDEGGDIVMNADYIRRGMLPDISMAGGDFFFVERGESASICRDLILLIQEKIPAKFKIPSGKIQILTPTKQGNVGVGRLNEILQEKCNPPDKKKPELLRGDHIFRLGDKVMQTKNNYSVKWRIYGINGIVGDEGEGIFNGDTGIVTAVNSFEKTLTVTFDDSKEVEYEKDMLDELELAYAITIHKSQGSEYPAVLIPLLEGPRMLYTRNLLYTAISRGTKCVMILGKWEMVKRMVETEGDLNRDTGLKDRLNEVFANDF